jgi:hypothetical protein
MQCEQDSSSAASARGLGIHDVGMVGVGRTAQRMAPDTQQPPSTGTGWSARRLSSRALWWG